MCNESLDLVKLLGNCPEGTKLYSPLLGEVLLTSVSTSDRYPIHVKTFDNDFLENYYSS